MFCFGHRAESGQRCTAAHRSPGSGSNLTEMHTLPPFRPIRSLRFLGLEEPVKVVLVTSALPGVGKSTVPANLAHSYAESWARTLLVSADLRRPQVESWCHLVGTRSGGTVRRDGFGTRERPAGSPYQGSY